jgi:hypothetical protein
MNPQSNGFHCPLDGYFGDPFFGKGLDGPDEESIEDYEDKDIDLGAILDEFDEEPIGSSEEEGRDGDEEEC